MPLRKKKNLIKMEVVKEKNSGLVNKQDQKQQTQLHGDGRTVYV